MKKIILSLLTTCIILFSYFFKITIDRKDNKINENIVFLMIIDGLKNYECVHGTLPKTLEEGYFSDKSRDYIFDKLRKWDSSGKQSEYNLKNRSFGLIKNGVFLRKEFISDTCIPFGQLYNANTLYKNVDNDQSSDDDTLRSSVIRDQLGWVKEINYLFRENLVYTINYSYDSNGRIFERRIVTADKNQSVFYQYDSRGNLISSSSADRFQQWEYDGFSNRIFGMLTNSHSKVLEQYCYPAEKNQILAVQSFSLPVVSESEKGQRSPFLESPGLKGAEYRFEGSEKNMFEDVVSFTPPDISLSSWEIHWLREENYGKKIQGYKSIILNEKDTSQEKYTLEPDFSKSRRFENGVWRYFTLANGKIIFETDERQNKVREFVWDESTGNLISFRDIAPEKRYYYITDIQGSILGIMGEEGEMIETYEYDAWGNILAVRDQDGKEITTSTLGNIHLWQSAEYFWDAKLYNFYGRLYDPVTGRWFTKIPLGFNGDGIRTLNFYPFCFNDPVNKIWRWLPKDSALLKNQNNGSPHEQGTQNVEALR